MTELVHLTPDEIDLWLEGRLPDSRTSHLATCDECRTAAEESREVVMQLRALPQSAPVVGFADRVLARVGAGLANPHLTDEELDDWLSDSLTAARQTHLRSCAACRALANQEKLLVFQLRDLPLHDPTPGFPDRVMAEVEIPATSIAGAWRQWRRRTFANPIAVGVASGLSVILGGSLAASAAWAAGNQEIMTGAWLSAWHATQQLFWLTLGAAFQRIAASPWYPSLLALFSPARAALLAGTVVILYGCGIVALRRLLALPQGDPARATL